MRGHESGVLSLSWCIQDSDLLLSSGKDNRTICWNPQTGQQYGEFPVVTNWTFQTRWNPRNPNLFATASFDGNIAVQTIQNTRSEAIAQAGISQNQTLNDEDFFAQAQTQPQISTFSLPKPPKWLERPVTASFGFGGRVISVGSAEPGKPGCRSSKIKITPFEIDSTVNSATETFESALKSGDLRSICQSRISDAKSDEEKADWKVIETLISEDPKKQLVEYLGFTGQVDEAADTLSKLGLGEKEAEDAPKPESSAEKRHKRISSIFDTNADSDSFLTDLAASKGAKTNNPFQIYTGSESEADRGITRALLLGQFEKALDICLQEDRMSDAFVIAICGGQKCIDKAQEAYFVKQANGPNYLRLLASIVGKNLWDVVHNADLANWKEAFATLCTFAEDYQFPDLSEALGDRLEEQSRTQNDKASRKDASFCYLVSSKLEKVVSIWIDELKENETSNTQSAVDDNSFSIHVRALQNLIEKVTVFRQVSNFQDSELQKPSDWKLSLLYDKYIEYANVVATHGRLDVADKYLSLLPQSYPEADVARDRIKLATKKSAPKPASHQPATAPRAAPKTATAYQPPRPSYSPGPVSNPYASPAAPVQPNNPYAPSYPPQHGKPIVQPTPGVPPGPATIPPPPRATNQSPSTVPYSQPTNVSAWNDLPEGFAKAPTPRRSTPSGPGAVVSSPFPNQTLPAVPPPNQPPTPGQRAAVPIPPPPKGPAPPPRMSSPSIGGPHGFVAPERPPSTSSSIYTPAPPPPAGQAIGAPQIPRGASPYNAPPPGPPPTNRYAPNPAAQVASPPLQSRPVMAPPPPPPAASQAPGPSPYAPQQFQQPFQQMPPQNPYAPGSPPIRRADPAHPTPPPGSAPTSRPSTAQSQRKPSAPPKFRKYPI